MDSRVATRHSARFGRLVVFFVVALLLPGPLLPRMNQAGAVQQAPTIYYTALGDSVTSGHGLLGDVRGDKYEGEDCKLSASSYPVKVGAQLGPTFGQELFPLNLACSGAGIGLGDTKDFENQVERAEKDIDSIPDNSPILITISMGANNFLDSGIIAKVPLLGREDYYNYIDTTLAYVEEELFSMVGQLLSHPNVSIVMVTYASPVPESYQHMCSALSSYAPECLGDLSLASGSVNPVTGLPHLQVQIPPGFRVQSMKRFDYFVSRLNEVVGPKIYEKFANTGRIDYTQGLRNAFWGHDCIGLQTWFQCPVGINLDNSSIAFLGDFVHPNEIGAQEIANQVAVYAAPLIRAALAPPAPPPDASIVDPPAPAVQSPGGGPTFHLPWRGGQSWYVTADNSSANHNDPQFYPELNRYAFDAQPLGADPTVVAIAGGEVIAAVNTIEYSEDQAYKTANSGGNCVAIDHGGGVYSAYAHMETGSVPVHVGQRVEAGQPIGRAGRTGFVFASSPLLHWTATSTRPDSRCLNGLSSPSTYADVGGDGIPRAGNSYTSGNHEAVAVAEPAAPVETSVPTEATETTEPAQVIAPVETAVPTETTAPESPPVVETPAQGAAQTAESAQGSGDMKAMQITAIACDSADPAAITAGINGDGSCYWDIGATFTVTTGDGVYIGSCTLTGDRNAEIRIAGNVNCTVPIPNGVRVVVTEDVNTITPGTSPVENPLDFTWPDPQFVASYNGVSFTNVPQSGTVGTSATGTSDVAIVTTENGQPVYDACYIFVGYGNEGCDENRDGKITFEDIPLGTWTVRQTADLGPGRHVADFTVQVTGAASDDGWERFPATIVTSGSPSTGSSDASGPGSSSSSGAVDIALITRDPDTGGLLTGTCYVLIGYGNEGCDENGDGQVTFADIPFGNYTVHQTQAPAGYPTINDYEIRVEPIQAVESPEMVGYPLSFVVKQAPEQNAPNTRNVSVVLIDARTNERVKDAFCLEIVGASIEGCDTDLPDGQVDFLDVPAGGPYEVNFTKIPPGYNVDLTFDGGPWLVSVNVGPDYPANRTAFVFVSSPGSASGAGGGTDATTGSSVPPAASSVAQDSGDMRDMQIYAVACDSADPAAIQAGMSGDGSCYWDIGATFSVSTEDGTYIGSCTLVGDRNAEIQIAGNVNCTVPVPMGVPVIVTEDVTTVTPGTAPRENPLSYTWPTDPQSVASYMGVGFFNVPVDGGTNSG